MDEEQKAFEASCGPRTDLNWSKQQKRYKNPVVHSCWKTWQKARATRSQEPSPEQVEAGVEALHTVQAREDMPASEMVKVVYLAMAAKA
ncbi:hypothetical protein [Burkholderia cenocepacia]|uniref:hypothetical protein n=1 Tax=Burkholderia cenocepacia TaxID=95486 RepID=UPI00076127C6|nr:hypothetical protein [Burkholderia cenocepacia]KWU24790.1 hypothetical protein AS149_32100 [Burkholderia cenocepacia]